MTVASEKLFSLVLAVAISGVSFQTFIV